MYNIYKGTNRSFEKNHQKDNQAHKEIWLKTYFDIFNASI